MNLDLVRSGLQHAGCLLVFAGALCAPCAAWEVPLAWRAVSSLPAEEAHQAAAADEQYLYAIGSRSIGKYDRKSGKRVAVSSGPAEHLNSGFFWRGKLYCAHSNYPQKPERSEILVLDPDSMRLTVFHRFVGQAGSLTWVVRHADAWWCNFAFYDAENAKSYLARFDDQWVETARWTYPAKLIEQLGRRSISGGVWRNGQLLVTDHDHRALYRLNLPPQAGVLQLVETQSAPFAGQGIALDPATGGLVGIVRKDKTVIVAEPVTADNK